MFFQRVKRFIFAGLLCVSVAFPSLPAFIRPALALNEYDLWVGGVRVTDENKGNIVGDTIVGSVSYDPLSHTLTLSNAIIMGRKGLNMNAAIYAKSSIPTLNIDIQQDNFVFSYDELTDDAAAIYVDGSLAINGTGYLGVIGMDVAGYSSYGICAKNGTVYIRGGELDVYGGWPTNEIKTNGQVFNYINRASAAYGIYAAGIDVSGGYTEACGGVPVTQEFIDAHGRPYTKGIGVYGSVKLSGGTMISSGIRYAIGRSPLLRNMSAEASPHFDGSDPAAYNSSKLESYKWFKAAPTPPRPVQETSIPQTGDGAPLLLLCGVALLSASGLAIRFALRQRGKGCL